ncbi:beta-lactamase/transpeptidase-like protein [Mycena amicta]|nr:beta-lactamase/transpeptidase-like protein [Mycena amicta]
MCFKPILCSSLFIAACGAKIVDSALFGYIDNILDEANIAGMSMAIISPDGQVEYANWGRRTEAGEPVTSDQFLSASLGILMQDFANGKNTTALPSGITQFNWSTKMKDLLPGEWEMDNEWATDKADLKDLLSHRTGLPTHDGCYSPDDTPADLVAKFKNLRTAYEMRQFWEYNNQMYIAGAYVVSKYSGMAYRDFFEERVFKPLNMTSSTMHPDVANATGRFSQTWSPLDARRIPFFISEHSADIIADAGGVISSVEDLVIWVKTMLNGGVDKLGNQTIVPQSTFDLATSAIVISSPVGDNITSIVGYGLGWLRNAYRGHEWLWHDGRAPGVASRIDIYPYDGFATIMLCNTAVVNAGTADGVARTVADRILQLPPIDHRVPPGVFVAVPPPPPNPPSTENLAGTYSNAGPTQTNNTSPSSSCKAVIEDFRLVDAAAGRPASQAESQLVAAWPRFWASHLRVSPVEDASASDSYAFQMTNLYAHGFGKNSTAFEAPNLGGGVGLFGVAVLPTIREVNVNGSVKDTADVWFDRVG